MEENHFKKRTVNLERELTSLFHRSFPLAASSSRVGHEPTACDPGGIHPWISQQSIPRGKPRGILSDR